MEDGRWKTEDGRWWQRSVAIQFATKIAVKLRASYQNVSFEWTQDPPLIRAHPRSEFGFYFRRSPTTKPRAVRPEAGMAPVRKVLKDSNCAPSRERRLVNWVSIRFQ